MGFILNFRIHRRIDFTLFFRFYSLHFDFYFVRNVTNGSIVRYTTFFRQQAFRLIALTFRSFTSLLFLHINRIRIFRRRILVQARLTFIIRRQLHIDQYYNDNIYNVNRIDHTGDRNENGGRYDWFARVLCPSFRLFVATFLDDIPY